MVEGRVRVGRVAPGEHVVRRPRARAGEGARRLRVVRRIRPVAVGQTRARVEGPDGVGVQRAVAYVSRVLRPRVEKAAEQIRVARRGARVAEPVPLEAGEGRGVEGRERDGRLLVPPVTPVERPDPNLGPLLPEQPVALAHVPRGTQALARRGRQGRRPEVGGVDVARGLGVENLQGLFVVGPALGHPNARVAHTGSEHRVVEGPRDATVERHAVGPHACPAPAGPAAHAEGGHAPTPARVVAGGREPAVVGVTRPRGTVEPVVRAPAAPPRRAAV